MNNKKFENCIDKAIEENLMNCTASQERTIKMERVCKFLKDAGVDDKNGRGCH